MSDSTHTKTKLSDIICEYGEAMRHDWSEIDGRCVRSDMETFASYIDKEQFLLDEEETLQLRTMLDLCPHGQGHWSTWCDEDCQ